MLVSTLLAALVSSAHAAAPDLTTSITQPSGVYVYASGMWQATVANVGSANAGTTTLTINLPRTNTSPTVYVMGTVGAKSSNCTQSGTTLTCTFASLRKARSSTVYFYMTLPESAGTIDFTATAATSGETNTSNNGSSAVAALLTYSPTFSTDRNVNNRHCTGTGLESFYECELFPSSISSHPTVFHTDGSITFPTAAGYTGTWSISGSELTFNYDDGTGIVAEFFGHGVDATACWEGLTTFPSSSYVAPYEVCLQ